MADTVYAPMHSEPRSLQMAPNVSPRTISRAINMGSTYALCRAWSGRMLLLKAELVQMRCNALRKGRCEITSPPSLQLDADGCNYPGPAEFGGVRSPGRSEYPPKTAMLSIKRLELPRMCARRSRLRPNQRRARSVAGNSRSPKAASIRVSSANGDKRFHKSKESFTDNSSIGEEMLELSFVKQQCTLNRLRGLAHIRVLLPEAASAT